MRTLGKNTVIQIFCFYIFFGISVCYGGEGTLKSKDLRFTPHITTEAWTGERGQVALQRAVGANLNTTFLLSSLTYSIHKRFEIGTVPINYFIDGHEFNVNLKYNFWRTDKFLWALGYSLSIFDLRDENDQRIQAELQLHSIQLVLNYFPEWTKLKFGFNFTTNSADFLEDQEGSEPILLDAQEEFGMDVSYPITQKYTTTLGLGWLREQGVSALEERHFGFGLSFRWYRPEKFLSSPTIGVHFTPETEDYALLYSTTFY